MSCRVLVLFFAAGRFIGLIFVSTAQTPSLKACESSSSSPGGLILIWIQLIECSLRPALSQFPSLPSTLVKTFAHFPRNQIWAVWLPTSSQRIAPPKQTDRTILQLHTAGQEARELLLVVLDLVLWKLRVQVHSQNRSQYMKDYRNEIWNYEVVLCNPYFLHKCKTNPCE